MAKKSSRSAGARPRSPGPQPAQGNGPDGPKIAWLNRVRRRFSKDEREDLEEALRGAYGQTADLDAIVVCDRLVGYSLTNRPIVLSIELIKNDRSHPKIVRIDDRKGSHRQALEEEYAAWTRLKGRLGSPDPLFMSLSDPTPGQARKVLEYDAALPALTSSDVDSLENAVVRSCRWGSPTPESIAQRIRNIYDYMNLWLFTHATPRDSAEVAGYYREKLREHIKTWWRPERVARRRPILLSFGGKPQEFQDPVDWLNWLLSPGRVECVPECIFGPCHGDVHGRNVLIGLSNGEAIDEAVYDYENMSLNRPIAWDFVKLEMELRVRALHFAIQALDDGKSDLARAMEFEQQLYQWTRKLDQLTHLPIRTRQVDFQKPYPEPWKRLFLILWEIRDRARVCLGGEERSECWKEEYFFTLAAYAVHTAKHPPSEPTQELAYIAGGVAAAHFAREDCYCPRTCLQKICRRPPKWTRQTTIIANAKQGPFGETGESLFPNYVFAMADPKGRVESAKKKAVKSAVHDLEHLHEMYPHAVPIEQEWALAKIELSTLVTADDEAARLRDVTRLRSEAERILNALVNEFPAGDEETLGKLGRYHKECAWAINRFGEVTTQDDTVHYQRALDCYLKAYALRKHYYPGINVATLTFLLGDHDGAKPLAKEVLETCAKLTPEQLQDVTERNWVEATRGEAHLILEQYAGAVERYRAAMSLDPSAAHAKSPRRHAQCILAKLPDDDDTAAGKLAVRQVLGIPEPNNPRRYRNFTGNERHA